MTKAVRAEQHVLRKVAEPVKPAVIDDEGPDVGADPERLWLLSLTEDEAHALDELVFQYADALVEAEATLWSKLGRLTSRIEEDRETERERESTC
jgi:hypothetical protein